MRESLRRLRAVLLAVIGGLLIARGMRREGRDVTEIHLPEERS